MQRVAWSRKRSSGNDWGSHLSVQVDGRTHSHQALVKVRRVGCSWGGEVEVCDLTSRARSG
jgi:hypothetical protein